MKLQLGVTSFLSGLLIFAASIGVFAIDLPNPETALVSYVNKDDGAFRIQHVVSVPGKGFTTHLFNMASQKWLTDKEVDRPLWTHSLVVTIPDVVNSTTGLLFVGGGDNDDPLPDGSNTSVQLVAQLALGSQSIVSAILQVPNQPLFFAGDIRGRREDRLVAHTWDNALKTGDYIWPAYLPMVKSVVKAMDGIQKVVPSLGNYSVDNFVLTGFSKRGAAVWLTAVVDPRVQAIAPGVIDILNISPSFEHHFKSYGAFSTAIEDYTELGIIDKLRSPEFRDLAKVIDPYSYIDRLGMPKFILNSSGDQFFLPDSSRFYFDDLVGETHIRFAPNTNHSLSNSQTGITDTLFSLLGWYQSQLYGFPLPDISWDVSAGVLSATTTLPPVKARVWTAKNPNARDFRKETIGETWTSHDIVADEKGKFVTPLGNDGDGFTATYIEFVYQEVSGRPVTYSTQVYVTPDIHPFELSAPVIEPRRPRFWQYQVEAALAGKPAGVDAETLRGYLPIPLFETIVSDLPGLGSVLRPDRHAFLAKAQRECMATRLNIRHAEVGWYSDADLDHFFGNKLLWEHYQLADQAAEFGFPWLSRFICKALNDL